MFDTTTDICIYLRSYSYGKLYTSIYSLWCLVPSWNIPQDDGHGKRASIFPYPYTISLVVEALPFYLYFFHACTPLTYPSIWQLVFLTY